MRLDRRVQFYRFTLVDDGFQSREVFAAHGASEPANRADASTREQMLAMQVQANITTRFTVRSSLFTRDITPKDKLASEGQFYDITGVRQVGRKQWLEITAAARSDLDVFPFGEFSAEFSEEFA